MPGHCVSSRRSPPQPFAFSKLDIRLEQAVAEAERDLQETSSGTAHKGRH